MLAPGGMARSAKGYANDPAAARISFVPRALPLPKEKPMKNFRLQSPLVMAGLALTLSLSLVNAASVAGQQTEDEVYIGKKRQVQGAAGIILQDGAKAIIDDNRRLFLVDKAGKRTLAKDGTFQTKDGKSIVVQRGIIIPDINRPSRQNPGAEKGIIIPDVGRPNPDAQGPKVMPGAAPPTR